MSDYVRWGILGAAKFAREHMGPALQLAPGGRLCALATGSAEKVDGFRQIAPDLKVHDSYEGLLADPDIDAVYIPLPNTLHVEWTKKAIEAGKHVLTEKPIAMQASEIDDLIAMRDTSGLVVAEAYMILHHPQWQMARQLLDEGTIGDLRHIDVMFCFNLEDMGNIRMNPDLGGGAIPDIGVYAFGSARYVTGLEPTDISARITRKNGVDVHSQTWARFGGATYSATLSIQMDPAQRAVFVGDKGQIEVTWPYNAELVGMPQVKLRWSMGREMIHRYPGVRQYELQVAAFNRSVLTGADYPVPLEFSRGTQAMIDEVFDAGQ